VAVIARQVDRNDVRVLRRDIPHVRPAAVARAVVDQDDFVIAAGGGLRCGRQAVMQRRKAGLLIVAGDNDRERWHHFSR